jgi:hypothetical protein
MVVIFVTYLVSRLLRKLWELYDQPDGVMINGTETGYGRAIWGSCPAT